MTIENCVHQSTKESSLTKKPSLSVSRVVTEEPQNSKKPYSPALYNTPELAPIPDVSLVDYFSNTYVINYKGRGGRSRPAEQRRADGFAEQLEANALGGRDAVPLSSVLETGKNEESFVGLVENGDIEEARNEDFHNSRDSLNVSTSRSDVEDAAVPGHSMFCNQLSVSFRSQDEYYDTAEDFFSDGSISSSSPSLKRRAENELHFLRLSLVEESNKRKAAEDNLLHLNKMYEKLLKCLSHSSKLSFHELATNIENIKNGVDPAENCHEYIIVRFISEALETDLAKDEAEEAFLRIVASKNHEISRLHDRMKYYEAVNREMSQWNQETVELARRRRPRTRKWIWGCVGLSITAGASILVAYSYMPHRGSFVSSASASSDSSSGITG